MVDESYQVSGMTMLYVFYQASDIDHLSKLAMGEDPQIDFYLPSPPSLLSRPYQSVDCRF